MNLITLITLSLVPYITTFFGLYILSDAWIALLTYHLIILIVLLKRNKGVERISYYIENKKLFFLSIISGLTIFPLLIIIWDYIKLTDLDLNNQLIRFNLDGLSFVIFIIYFFTIHPFLEELYWRNVITYRGNPKVDYLFDIIFAGYHFLVLVFFVKITFVIISIVILAISAMLWRYIIKKHQDYLTVFTTHSIADLMIMLAVYVLR